MTNHFDFRSWIKTQSGNYTFVEIDNDHYHLETDYAISQINFYHVDPEPEIVEFRIDEKDGSDAKFFLHFHADHEDHARELFSEMVQTLEALKNQQVKEILLCCTSGLTTSFFAEKLNEAAQTLGYKYAFSAVSVNDIYEEGVGKAAILLAPQIRYMENQLKQVMPDSAILSIPTKIFGTYDANACVQMVDLEIQNMQKTAEEKALTKANQNKEFPINHRVLIVSGMVNNAKAHIYYRVYDHEKIITDEVVIKNKLNLRDIEDAIDTEVCSCTGRIDVDVIGIAIPGIVTPDGVVDLPPTRNTDLMNGQREKFAFAQYFEEKYNVPVFVCNNTNAAAVGWYGQQEAYKNIVFYSQPRGWSYGGKGIIVDGKIVNGAHNSAGEIKYVMDRFRYSTSLNFSPFNPDHVMQLVVNAILMDVAILDPEIICIRSELIPDMEEVKNELRKCLPEDHIPNLVHIDDYNSYIMIGTLFFALYQYEIRNESKSTS